MDLLYKYILTTVFILISVSIFAQGIKGKVTSESSGEEIPGASIIVAGQQIGTVSDSKGNYFLSLKPGTYNIQVTYIGYQTKTASATIASETISMNFAMAEEITSLQEVVFLGTRSSSARTNIDRPVPIDVLKARDVKNFAQNDVSQILNFSAPSFSSNRQTVADGTDHIDPASLRGLGPDQVLVLVNGKRQHTTALVNINGTFGRGTVGTDMNSIPVAMIERIEVLRDGASAQYGSDAIAGVINIVLKKNTPLYVSTTYGQSASSTLGRYFKDGKTFQFDFSKGFSLGDKGFVSVGGQYLDRGATNRGGLDTRPLLYTSLPSKGAGESDEDFAARYAQLKANDDAKAQSNGLSRNNMRVGNSHSKNIGLFANGQYALGAGAEVYGTAGYSKRMGDAAGFYRLPSQSSQIDVTLYPNGFLPIINTNIDDFTTIAGVKGKLASWNYDLSNAFGGNSVKFDISNTLNASLPIGTSPTEFYAGTLKFKQNTTNLDISRRFDIDKGLLSSLNVAYGGEFRVDNYQIKAGDELSYSFGQPSKDIPGRMIGSSFTAAGAQVFPGYRPSNEVNESRNNKGIYADVEGEFGSKVLLEAAGRFENYSDFGSNFSYKFTGRYKFFKDFAVRGAIATGFRAPSLHQRYFNNESTQFVQGNPTQVLTVNNDNDVVRQFGVGSLKAETSASYSIGLTGKIIKNLTFTIDAYQIDIDNRIVFSSQYSRERDGSGALNPSGLVNQILNTVDPSAQINSVQFFTNAITTKTKGLDIVLNDKFDFGSKAGVLTLTAAANFNETKVESINGSEKIESDPALKARLFDRRERSRFESSVPKSKINLSAAYALGKWNFMLRGVRFGEVTVLNAVDPTIPANNLPLELDQTFSAKWVTDLSIGYNFLKFVNFTVGVNNLFDVYPDKSYIDPRNNEFNFSGSAPYSATRDNTSNGRFMYSREATQFGFNGRFVFGKLTLGF